MCACMHVCVRVHACVRARVHTCVCVKHTTVRDVLITSVVPLNGESSKYAYATC